MSVRIATHLLLVLACVCMKEPKKTCDWWVAKLENEFSCASQAKLGAGGFGDVYRVVRNSDNLEFAMKTQDWSLLGRNTKDRILRERQLELAAIEAGEDHPNIIQYITHYTDEKSNYVIDIVELAPGNNLNKFAFERRKAGVEVTVDEILCWIAQAANGLGYLHSKNYIHRDIKPDNLVMKEGTIKIIDFGKAIPIGTVDADGTGDVTYADPATSQDMVNRSPFTPASDVYSLGVTLHELVFDYPLYGTPGTKKVNLFETRPINSPEFVLPAGTDETVAYLISRMTLLDPTQRPTTKEIIEIIQGRCGAEKKVLDKDYPLTNKKPFARSSDIQTIQADQDPEFLVGLKKCISCFSDWWKSTFKRNLALEGLHFPQKVKTKI